MQGTWPERERETKWNLAATTWMSLVMKRKRGRLGTRWMDELVKFTGPQWASRALNRVHWKRMADAYAQRWAH